MPIIALFAIGYLLVVGTQAAKKKVSAAYADRTAAWDKAHPGASPWRRRMHRASSVIAGAKYGTPLALRAYRDAAKEGWAEGKNRADELWRNGPRTESPLREGAKAGKAKFAVVPEIHEDNRNPEKVAGGTREDPPPAQPEARRPRPTLVPQPPSTPRPVPAPDRNTATKGSTDMPAGEVSTPEQLLAQLKLAESRAVAELEDAKSNEARADAELVIVEHIIASMKNFKFSPADLAFVIGLRDPAAANKSAAQVRLAAADSALAAARQAVQMAAKHVSLQSQGAVGAFYQGSQGGTPGRR